MIRLEDVEVRAGSFALRGISLEVRAGEYAVLMGRTGSGKTTILETICGLRRAEAGRIVLAGTDVTDARPSERGIGYVPQDGALFESLAVREHLAFALRIRRWPRAEIARRVERLASLLELDPLLERKPRGLSGGERQRVALGRALSFGPAVILLDEPLGALDEEAREEIGRLLKRIQREERITLLHVTHSSEEAARLGDRLLRLQDGAVREETLPETREGARNVG